MAKTRRDALLKELEDLDNEQVQDSQPTHAVSNNESEIKTETDNAVKVLAQKKPRTPAQIANFERMCAIRKENEAKRKAEREAKEQEEKVALEQKILKKAAALERKKKKEQKALESIPSSEDEKDEPIKEPITKKKELPAENAPVLAPKPQQPVPEKPKITYKFF